MGELLFDYIKIKYNFCVYIFQSTFLSSFQEKRPFFKSLESVFAIIYHCHSFATKYFNRAKNRVKSHVRKDVDNRNESTRDGDGLWQIPK